ncbi:hypothetical protein BSKO_02166 [Bryopsis sp. KO-2023]|nr:hypothetical protein BSKO_02166 [Bryopsis sp. KO-2023]
MVVSVEIRPGNFAIVTLRREPVNALNLSVWQELHDALKDLENDKRVRGAIFCSGLTRDIFSAGNDLGELYAPQSSEERYYEFWTRQNYFLSDLYKSPLVTVAAIRGQCPAGGCILSMCCDYTVMTETGSIGLNEVALGIPVPVYWGRLMGTKVGHSVAEKLLLTAKLLSPQEALKIGLVDETVPKRILMDSSEKAVKGMLKFPDNGRQETKNRLRGEFAREWAGFAGEEAKHAWGFLSDPKTVKFLGGVMQKLSGKSKM